MRLTEGKENRCKKINFKNVGVTFYVSNAALYPAPQHHIGSKHAVPIVEPDIPAALFRSMAHSL